MLSGIRPMSLVSWVPMPKPVCVRSAKCRYSAIACRQVEAVGEHQALGVRVDAQPGVVRERLLAPLDRIARVVAQAVEQLGEVEVEIGQEGVHADHVGQRDPRSPRYSCTQSSSAAFWKSRSRTPSAW